jgi:hypothetical protein
VEQFKMSATKTFKDFFIKHYYRVEEIDGVKFAVTVTKNYLDECAASISNFETVTEELEDIVEKGLIDDEKDIYYNRCTYCEEIWFREDFIVDHEDIDSDLYWFFNSCIDTVLSGDIYDEDKYYEIREEIIHKGFIEWAILDLKHEVKRISNEQFTDSLAEQCYDYFEDQNPEDIWEAYGSLIIEFGLDYPEENSYPNLDTFSKEFCSFWLDSRLNPNKEVSQDSKSSPSKEVGQNNKCSCDITSLINLGCKCGAV